MSRMSYVVSYDTADDKRRASIYKTLRDYGDHVQFSVFFCELNARELAVLRGLLDEAVKNDEDQVLIVRLGVQPVNLETALDCLGRKYEPASRVQVI